MHLYLVRRGQEKLFMENVDRITQEGDDLVLRDMFGEEKRIKARFREASLFKHRIVIEEV
jgi:predicted RNA-binding protein